MAAKKSKSDGDKEKKSLTKAAKVEKGEKGEKAPAKKAATRTRAPRKTSAPTEGA